MSYRCPACASGYTQKIALMYSAETRRWSGYRGGGVSQTDLAAGHPPPQSRSSFWRKVLVGILCYILLALGGILSRSLASSAAATPTVQVVENPQPLGSHVLRKRRNARHEAATQQPTAAPAAFALPPQTQESKRSFVLQIMGAFAVEVSLIALLLWSIRRTNQYNRNVWEPASREWNSSFLCKACGEVFIPA